MSALKLTFEYEDDGDETVYVWFLDHIIMYQPGVELPHDVPPEFIEGPLNEADTVDRISYDELPVDPYDWSYIGDAE